MTKIAYDVTEIFTQSFGRDVHYGIARVVAEIAYQLVKSDYEIKLVLYSAGHRKFFEILPKFDESAYAGVDLNIPTGAKPLKFRSVRPRSNFMQSFLSLAVGSLVRAKNRSRWKKAGIELSEADLSGYKFFSAGRPKIVVDMVDAIRTKRWDTEVFVLLHDFFAFHEVDERYGGAFAQSFLHDNNYLIERADVIVPNSHFTANDLLQFAKKSVLHQPKKIKVLQLAQESIESGEQENIFLPDCPFFLMVGSQLGRKNLEVVLSAMQALKESGRTVPMLVLAGRKRSSTVRYIKRPEFEGIREQIRFIVYPNQTDLNRLYKAALATVIPSKMEGWGLPAGEALHLGCPVISAKADALMECCGDLGTYFNPEDAEELADLMELYATDETFRNKQKAKVAAGRNSLRTWKMVTDDLFAIMRD